MTNPGPPPWQTRLTAALKAHEATPAARYAQLATVRPGGWPANRTVVFRGFLEPGGRLLFATDRRSAKVRDLAADPRAEVCWYFPETREQFRLAGRVGGVTGETPGEAADARERVWRSLAGPSRQSFTWPPPGQPWPGPEAFAHPAPDDPPPVFLLLIVDPERVDHLTLDPGGHERTAYERTGENWTARRINP